MLELKFKDRGTAKGIAQGLTKFALYFAAMRAHPIKPAELTNPEKDFWAIFNKTLAYYEAKTWPNVVGKFSYDESKDPLMSRILSKEPLEVKPSVEASIRVYSEKLTPLDGTFNNILNRMGVLGQLLSDDYGSFVEPVRRDIKSRFDTLYKSGIFDLSGIKYYETEVPNVYIVGGKLPYAVVSCAKAYGLESEPGEVEIKIPEPEVPW